MIKPNILIAIPYCNDKAIAALKEQKARVNILLDSGAFTAWKSGKEITLDQYCKFIETVPFDLMGYFTLDKIGDHEGTKQNLLEIRRRGFAPIPIFTRGDSLDYLEEMYTFADIVGIGSLVGTKGNRWFLETTLAATTGKKRKVHWLGFTDRNYLANHQPFSVDTSIASGTSRYKRVVIYAGNGILKSFDLADLRDDTANTIPKIKFFADWCQEDLYGLQKFDGWKAPYLCTAANITHKAVAYYAIEAEKKFGTKIFFAVNSAMEMQACLDAWDFVNRKITMTERRSPEASP